MILEVNSDGDEPIEVQEGNLAMADAMRKVLNMGKNTGNTSLVLSKAKVSNKATQAKKVDIGFEVEKNSGDEDAAKEESKEDVKPAIKFLKRKRIKKQEVSALGRIKPTVLDREKEKPLMKMATRGVVQLFNAVRDQQKFISKRMDEVGPSETKKEKVLKSIDKKAFLDVLLGQTNNTKQASPEPEVKTENEDEDEKEGERPSWGVLREDFMMGAKLKDWDKSETPTETSSKPKRAKKRN